MENLKKQIIDLVADNYDYERLLIIYRFIKRLLS